MARGESSAECLRRYPEHSEELGLLLGTASACRSASVGARPEARARGLERLNRALAERGVRRRRPVLSWLIGRPAVLGLILALLTAVTAGWTTVASSTDTVPGDPLYWVKTTRETITLRVNRSDEARAHAHARLAGERGEEIRKLTRVGRMDDAEALVERLDRHLEEAAMLAGVMLPAVLPEMPVVYPESAGYRVEIRASLERDGAVMRVEMLEIWLEAPPDQKPMVQQMLRRTLLRYQLFITALDDEMPPGRAFWAVVPSGGP